MSPCQSGPCEVNSEQEVSTGQQSLASCCVTVPYYGKEGMLHSTTVQLSQYSFPAIGCKCFKVFFFTFFFKFQYCCYGLLDLKQSINQSINVDICCVIVYSAVSSFFNGE